MISLLQAANLFDKKATEPFTPATEAVLSYVHAALQLYVLGLPDRYAPSLEIDNAQQFLIQQKLLSGPADSHWSVAFASGLRQVFAPLAGTGELMYIGRLMFERQGRLLLSAYTASIRNVPAAAKRALGLLTDRFSDSVKWRVTLLDQGLVSVYDTHAAIGSNVPIVGLAYSARPEVRQAVAAGLGWSTRRGDEYGVTDLVNYIAARLDVASLPYRVVLFSRIAS